MADLNTVYNGVIEYFDPKADSGVLNPSTIDWFGFGGSNFWLEEMPFWPELDAINKASASTVAAVKVAYDASQDRAGWINERLKAIENRVSFIKGRVDQLFNNLKASGSSAYDGLMKGFTTALTVIPVVGTAISYFAGKSATALAVEQAKLQQLIQDYTADLGQLAQIRAQLVKELVAIDPDAGKKYEAPKVPAWYWLAGAGVLGLLIFLWYRKRRKRRKR